MKRSKGAAGDEVPEANVLPVMNIMFLLIPALLLAMEVASMAAIQVSPPKFVDRAVNAPTPPQREPFRFKVTIQSDGIAAEVNGQAPGADLATGEAGRGRIARKDGELDLVALTQLARDLKSEHGEETIVSVTAEKDVPYREIIAAMDALRGPECSLRDPAREGCLFWQPIVESV